MCCNDWGNEHPLGYLASSGWKNGLQDYDAVLKKIQAGHRGFALMSAARMPEPYNRPERKVSSLAEIWSGGVRRRLAR